MMNLLENLLDITDIKKLQDSALIFRLEEWINRLILEDFEKLVTLLYRIDVSEQKLKTMLAENKSSDAGKIIAKLIIDRQLQKIRLKKVMRDGEDDSCEEERW